MKLLVDACAGVRLANALRTAGHDVDFVGDWERDPGDDEILRIGHEQKRIVITRDKDFGTLAVLQRQPNCGIVRLVELPADRELSSCLDALARHAEELHRGCLVTVEVHRIRIRENEQR